MERSRERGEKCPKTNKRIVNWSYPISVTSRVFGGSMFKLVSPPTGNWFYPLGCLTGYQSIVFFFMLLLFAALYVFIHVLVLFVSFVSIRPTHPEKC